MPSELYAYNYEFSPNSKLQNLRNYTNVSEGFRANTSRMLTSFYVERSEFTAFKLKIF